MSKVMFDELKQISSEMKAIEEVSDRGGRKASKKEREVLDQLADDKEELLGDIIFHGYGSMH